ncbi:MAG: response regulator [Nitrospirales bacterium]|nr:MAG: response regulator [Nitrospirales bacterium]
MKRVLLVDDNHDARRALKLVLESQGLECIESINGALALEWLNSETADLIVTDNKMPVLTGLEFIERLSSKPDAPSPPIILLSGNLDEADKTRARNAGTYAILNKPCNFSEFLSIVSLALEQPPRQSC